MYKYTFLFFLVFSFVVTQAQILDLPDDTPACNVDKITLDAGEGFDTYVWSPGGETSQMIDVTVPGEYSVVVTLDGDEQNDTTVVTFYDYEMLVEMDQINEICYGSCDGQVMAHVVDGVRPYEYLWNNYPVPWDSIATSLCPGDNNLLVTDANGCVLSYDFVVEALPAADIEINIDPSDTLYLQNPTLDFSFINNGDNIINEWRWEFGDGDTSYIENPTHVYEKILNGLPDSYTVFFSATNEFGCDTLIATELPIKEAELKIPNIITPNGDGANDKFVIQNAQTGTDIKFEFESVELVVYNRSGRVIYKDSHYQSDWQPDNLADGTYYYVLVTHGHFKDDKYHGALMIMTGGN